MPIVNLNAQRNLDLFLVNILTLISYHQKWVKNKCVSKCLNSSKTNNAMKIFLGGDIFDTWENWLGLKINSYKLIDFTIVYYWTFMVQRAHAVFSVWFFLKNKFLWTYRFHYSIIIQGLFYWRTNKN